LRLRITANHVTLARLVPMPLIAWWIYAEHYWTALIVGTIVGCTDFVDGWMARRSGPTVLGGLLDPMADKVFVALIYAPFADKGMIPWWACGLMFMREFLVTALRSVYERRSLSMKTSYLGKVKTWTQMQGIGVILLFAKIGDRPVMTWLLIGGLVAPLIAMAILYGVKKKVWKGAIVMTGSFAVILGVHLLHDLQLTMDFIMLMVVSVTWISGLDYIGGAWTHLRGRGDFGSADAVRIVGGLLLPALVFVVIARDDATNWPLLVILGTELAVGGLDNLLSHHQKASGALAWGARVFGVLVLLAATLILPQFATLLAVLAGALSTAGVAWEFWRGRDYYLDARLRDKAPRGVALQQSSG
jgi:CDP-diacylglycerol--glycerol-3-phosphate 3-phosphatidyltransferase